MAARTFFIHEAYSAENKTLKWINYQKHDDQWVVYCAWKSSVSRVERRDCEVEIIDVDTSPTISRNFRPGAGETH